MRPLSVTSIKRNKDNSINKVPKMGGVTRVIYDRLVNGEIIDKKDFKNPNVTIEYLMNFYGLDIESNIKQFWLR